MNFSSEAERVLFLIQSRMAQVILWTIFAVVHLLLFVVLLALLWWRNVQPSEVVSWFQQLTHATILEILGYTGLGLSTTAVLYVKGYRRASNWLLSLYLFAR